LGLFATKESNHMNRSCWVLGAIAAAILWMGSGPGRADDDTLKLDLKKGKQAATTNLLGSDDGADTVRVGHGGHGGGSHGGGGHGGGGHGGGGHVSAGHFHGGHVSASQFHGGHVSASHFHGGHVSAGHFHGGHVHAGHFHDAHFHDGHFHGGHFHDGHFHNGAFGWAGSGFGFWPGYDYPYYSYYYPSSYYSPYFYEPLGFYYPSADYVGPSVYYAPDNYYDYPNGYGLSPGSRPLPTPGRSVMPPATGPEETIPMPRPQQKGGTYPYDGGPANPVPMPQAVSTPSRKAGIPPTSDGRLVAAESKAPKYTYQAYGEKPALRKVGEDRQFAAKAAK
jgi:hypothetical protein